MVELRDIFYIRALILNNKSASLVPTFIHLLLLCPLQFPSTSRECSMRTSVCSWKENLEMWGLRNFWNFESHLKRLIKIGIWRRVPLSDYWKSLNDMSTFVCKFKQASEESTVTIYFLPEIFSNLQFIYLLLCGGISFTFILPD